MAIDNVRRKQLKEANKSLGEDARKILVHELNMAIIGIMEEELKARTEFEARKIYLLADLQGACDHPELAVPTTTPSNIELAEGQDIPDEMLMVGCRHCGLMVRKSDDSEEYLELMTLYNLQQVSPKDEDTKLEEAVQFQKELEAKEVK